LTLSAFALSPTSVVMETLQTHRLGLTRLDAENRVAGGQRPRLPE